MDRYAYRFRMKKLELKLYPLLCFWEMILLGKIKTNSMEENIIKKTKVDFKVNKQWNTRNWLV